MPTVPEKDTTDVMQAALDEAGFDANGELNPDPPDVTDDIDTTTDDTTTDDTVTTADPVADVMADETVTDDTIVEPDPDAEAAAAADAEAAKKAAAKATATDEFDKMLDEFGWRLPKPGQKENKIPQSRARARAKTLLKKVHEQFGTERTALTTKLSAADTELQTFRRADAAIAAGATDPAAARHYIEMLAAIHPAYKVFLGGGGTTDTAVSVPQALKDLGPKPGPDLRYDDGTVGFSPEQLEKRDEWLAASAEIRGYERSKKEFETRFGPFEKAHKDTVTRQTDLQAAEARIAEIREDWGQPFIDQENLERVKKGSSDIAKYQAAHPGVPFERVVRAVLLPKLRADRTTIRQEVITDLNRRKKVAKPSTGQASRTVTTGPKTTEEIIQAEIDRAGIDRD